MDKWDMADITWTLLLVGIIIAFAIKGKNEQGQATAIYQSTPFCACGAI